MAYKVKRNNATGAFECHFEHDGHKYFARVRYVPMSSGAASSPPRMRST